MTIILIVLGVLAALVLWWGGVFFAACAAVAHKLATEQEPLYFGLLVTYLAYVTGVLQRLAE